MMIHLISIAFLFAAPASATPKAWQLPAGCKAGGAQMIAICGKPGRGDAAQSACYIKQQQLVASCAMSSQEKARRKALAAQEGRDMDAKAQSKRK
jgi:hypothetical protein